MKSGGENRLQMINHANRRKTGRDLPSWVAVCLRRSPSGRRAPYCVGSSCFCCMKQLPKSLKSQWLSGGTRFWLISCTLLVTTEFPGIRKVKGLEILPEITGGERHQEGETTEVAWCSEKWEGWLGLAWFCLRSGTSQRQGFEGTGFAFLWPQLSLARFLCKVDHC